MSIFAVDAAYSHARSAPWTYVGIGTAVIASGLRLASLALTRPLDSFVRVLCACACSSVCDSFELICAAAPASRVTPVSGCVRACVCVATMHVDRLRLASMTHGGAIVFPLYQYSCMTGRGARATARAVGI